VCFNGPRADEYWHRDNGQPRPEPTDEDLRAEHAAVVRDAMGPPPLLHHRRKRYRKHCSEVQRMRRRLKLKATK
jgi:hypothetical protein